MARKTVSQPTPTQTKQPTQFADQPSQIEIARERTIANEYENLLQNGIAQDIAAAGIAHNFSTPTSTVAPADIPLIAQRVKQRDNA